LSKPGPRPASTSAQVFDNEHEFHVATVARKPLSSPVDARPVLGPAIHCHSDVLTTSHNQIIASPRLRDRAEGPEPGHPAQARKVLDAQSRLRALLRADRAMLTGPDLPVMLRRLVDVAVEDVIRAS